MADAKAVTSPVALTPAERQRLRRQRQKAGQAAPTCSCGAILQPGTGALSEARMAAGLCRACWLKTPGGAAAERLRKASNELTDKARERKRLWAQKARDKAKQERNQG